MDTVTSAPEPAPEAPLKEVETNPGVQKFMGMFPKIYALFSVILTVLFFMILLLALADIAEYTYNESTQATTLLLDPKLMIEDTNDYKIINYPTTNDDDEPYRVYMSQKIISFILILVSFALMVFGFQVGIHFVLTAAAKFSNVDYNEDLKLDDPVLVRSFATIITIGAVTLGLNALYKNKFVKGLQPELKDARARMRDIRNHVIRNIPLKDETFWKLLKSQNNIEIAQKIAMLLKNVDPRDKSESPPNIVRVRQILFACNLYAHFQNTIPESDSKFPKFDGIFSTKSNKPEYDINKFFLYSNIPNIKNVAFSELEHLIKREYQKATSSTVGRNNTNYLSIEDFIDRYHIDQSDATSRMNDKIDVFRNLGTYKTSFWKFLLAYFFTAMLIFVLVCMINSEFIKTTVWPKMLGVWTVIQTLWEKLFKSK